MEWKRPYKNLLRCVTNFVEPAIVFPDWTYVCRTCRGLDLVSHVLHALYHAILNEPKLLQ